MKLASRKALDDVDSVSSEVESSEGHRELMLHFLDKLQMQEHDRIAALRSHLLAVVASEQEMLHRRQQRLSEVVEKSVKLILWRTWSILCVRIVSKMSHPGSIFLEMCQRFMHRDAFSRKDFYTITFLPQPEKWV